jgi:hypothetical protein
MMKENILGRVAILASSIALLTTSGISYGVDLGNMINPSKWFGGNKNRGDYYDDRWGGPGYGYGGPGYGYGGPGYGYGGPGYGYGGPGYGYGAPGYGSGNPNHGYDAPGQAGAGAPPLPR